jgi:hypothetical protein
VNHSPLGAVCKVFVLFDLSAVSFCVHVA